MARSSRCYTLMFSKGSASEMTSAGGPAIQCSSQHEQRSGSVIQSALTNPGSDYRSCFSIRYMPVF